MKKVIKWGAITIGSLVLVVIIALLVIPSFVDLQKYKPEFEKWVSDKTNRPFSIGDNPDLSLFPWAGIHFTDLHLGNTSDFAEKDFLTIKSFELRVKLLPLLSRNIQVKQFMLKEPRIVLVKNKNGEVNWDFLKDTTGKKGSSKEGKEAEKPSGKASKAALPIRNFEVGKMSISDGMVVWTDHSNDTRKEISRLNMTIEDTSLDRPIQFTLSAQMDKQPLSLDGVVGPLSKALKGGSIPLDLSVKALNVLSIGIKGNIDNPLASPSVDTDIELAEFSPRKLATTVGSPFPLETTDPNTLKRIALKAHIKANAKTASISNGVFDLDDSKLNFSLKASEFTRPVVTFDFNLDRINLDRYLPPRPEKQSTPKETKQGTSGEKKIDYVPLRRLVVDGKLTIGNLTVNKAEIKDLLVKITAKDGIIDLDPLSMRVYQGEVAGNASLNVQRDTPKSAVVLKVDKVQINPLLKDSFDKDFLEGVTDAQISLSSVGDDGTSIKKNLSGRGKLFFKDGAIKGIDLAGMIRNAKAAFGLAKKSTQRPRTDFAELVAPFTINKGIVKTPQTSMKSPLFRITVSGKADLVREKLDLRVEPKVVGTIKGQGDTKRRSGLMVPVLVSGTFSSPRFRPDLKSAVTQKLRKKVLESKEVKKVLESKEVKKVLESEKVKKVLEKKEMKTVKEKSKDLLKGLLSK